MTIKLLLLLLPFPFRLSLPAPRPPSPFKNSVSCPTWVQIGQWITWIIHAEMTLYNNIDNTMRLMWAILTTSTCPTKPLDATSPRERIDDG
jgi:hypothetical protein